MTDNDLSLARSRQKTVDAMRSLINGYSLPREYWTVDSARLEGWFDVNAYFSVLSHLSMQPGYTLDYVYHGRQLEGHPYMYARRVDSKPFSSLKELTQSSNTDMLKTPTVAQEITIIYHIYRPITQKNRSFNTLCFVYWVGTSICIGMITIENVL
ncbi:MAG: hypothetical protein GXX97_05150 [Dehalococcoidales bacterium]|nr:hypothetical protein [Dehalococcoidales bacterium]